jgi:hypothetical protein
MSLGALTTNIAGDAMKRGARIEIYVPYDTKDQLKAMAQADGRELSPFLCRWVLEHLRMVHECATGGQQQSLPLCAPQNLPAYLDH